MTKTSKIRTALRSWFVLSIAVCLLAGFAGEWSGFVSAAVCGFWWSMTEN